MKGEGNSVNYKYRMHDPRIGRFFAIDPLTAKYPWYTPYSFSGNIVVNAIEIEGLEPGVLFSTPEQAAVNFGKYYNDNSIREGVEYGSKIYKNVDPKTKKITYSYVEALVGSSHSTSTDVELPSGAEEVAPIHTHGEYLQEGDNEFSGENSYNQTTLGTSDIKNAIKRKEDSYVITPNGTVRKFDYKKFSIYDIGYNAPSDSDDPTRKNSIPSSYENFIKLDIHEFNSDKLKKLGDNLFEAQDVYTGDKFNVSKNKNGQYFLYTELESKKAVSKPSMNPQNNPLLK